MNKGSLRALLLIWVSHEISKVVFNPKKQNI